MNEPLRMFEAYQDVEFTADWCVKCNICTSACPVAPVTDLFPGPKTVGPQAQRFRRDQDRGDESPDWSVDYCSGCGICSMAVHAYGTYGVPPFNTNNHGTRITQAVFNNLTAWRNAP